MSQNLCANTYKMRPALLRTSVLAAFILAALALLGNTGCEDKAIGRPCDVLTDASLVQGVYNSEALECPSRICLKPIAQTNASMPTPPTTSYCSASCSQDSDCDGQTRDPKNSLDTRCATGYTCGIPFVRGKICCQKLCLCKDFIDPKTYTPNPIACQGGEAQKCNSQ
jgi:hypothetical protein